MANRSQATRQKILDIVRKRVCTAEQLAHELDITPAAVRSQLNHLEQSQLVERGDLLRGGAGQPAILYRATEVAEDAFSSAYKPMLVTLLDSLPDSMSGRELNQLMRTVGKKLAANQPAVTKTIEARVRDTASALEDLGALIEIEHDDCDIRIKSYACPLAAAVKCRPEVCTAVKTFISEATAHPVKEKCRREETPLICEFVFPKALA